MNVRRAFDDISRERTNKFKEGREILGENVSQLVARAIETPLIQNQDAEILGVIQRAVLLDTRDGRAGKKDYGLRLAYVLDQNQKLVVMCFEDPDLKCIPANEDAAKARTEHESMTPALGQLANDTWKQAIESWREVAASKKGDVLVRYELTSGGSRYRVFAQPIFVNGPATAAGAIAADAGLFRRGYVVLAYDLAPIEWFAQQADEEKAEASTRAAIYTGAVGALFALIGTVLAIFQGLSISRPIKQLAWRADQIARGDLEARVEITSGDEIGFLGENFNFMADQIAILLQQTAEKARLEQELEVAKAIQESLVPGEVPVDRGALKFAGYYLPAAQTGGDWWTWAELVGGKTLLVIGDVTGHGVPSAMITAAAKAACDVARHVHGDDVTVTRLLEIMNHAIFESAQRRFVMTCFASIVDPRNRTITYANAGHNFPYLFRAGEGKGEFGSLMIRGNRLGDDRASRYEAKTTELVAGDVVVWYTDGIVECENEVGEEYGEKRFRNSVRRAAALDAGEMRDAIVAEATSFFGDTPRKDDITMIVGRIH
jgi:serine phosphatase RsbU (regulator of sigma subunit)